MSLSSTCMSGPCVTLITLTFWTATAHFIQCLVGTSLGRASILLSHARCELSQRRALTPSRATPCEQRAPALPPARCLSPALSLRPAESVVLITATVVWDTPLDCHFSAWSRPKPAPDPLPGPSVASGVIPTKGGRNGVLQPPAGRAPQGRWRSSPWKRCNHAPPRSRVREHPAPLGALRPGLHQDRTGLRPSQGAPRTARCIKTFLLPCEVVVVSRQGAPRTAGLPSFFLRELRRPV